jgi:cytochrome P450
MMVFRLNANVLPITAWALMELVRDRALFEAARKEASLAFDNGQLDMKKLIGLPLLQSIYHECLRMHVAVNLTRVVDDDMNLDGYMLKKDYLVQTPSWISHFDEGVWATPDHPASEFWAERHLRHEETTDESGRKVKVLRFSMEGKSGHFFPFGQCHSVLYPT